MYFHWSWFIKGFPYYQCVDAIIIIMTSNLLFPDIFVPPDQVIDTVDLYFLRNRQRRLSLRFLAWFVLQENIQTDTHDSIEDALSALRLYKAYQDFESRDIFDDKLEELYREGKKHVSLLVCLCVVLF